MARIAVFDDNHLARQILAGMLRMQGHAVMDYDPTSLFEALRTLREDTPDLVMVDLMMPQCPGMSLIRAIQEDPLLHGLRIIVVASPAQADTVGALMQLGILGFVTKPLDVAELERHVAEALQCGVPEAGRTPRVAVIHPHHEIQTKIHQTLAPAGYQVVSVVPSSFVEALGLLVADPPDLIVIGLGLVVFPALSLIRAVREDHRLIHLPLLVMAGDEDEVPEGLVESFNIAGLVPLPLQAAEFQAQVRRSLLGTESKAAR